MRLKVFKFFVLGFLMLGGKEVYAGIPVYCYNCQEGSSNAGHSILDGIRNQTEALLNAWDYAVKADAKLELAKDTAILKTERAIANAKTYDPTLSKPDTACTTFKSANLRSAISGGATGKTKDAILSISKGHNLSSSRLSETEPKRQYFVEKVLQRMDAEKEDDVASSAKVILSEPVPEDKLAKRLEEISFLTNPFPVETPTAEALKHIKKKGSTGDKDSMARVLVNNDRIERSQAILLAEELKNAQIYEAKSLDGFVKQIKAAGTDEQKAMLKGKLSSNQIDEVIATYRVRSPKWVAKTMKVESTGVLREQVLIQAEILNQLWEIKDLLRTTKLMQAWSDTQNTVQSGTTKQ